MIAWACMLASATGFYLSLNLGEIWPLAWIAPGPMLWLAFGGAPTRVVFPAAWAAYALGSTNLLAAYWRALPVGTLIVALAGPGFGFACAVLGARRVARAVGPGAGAAAFAALWTSWDFVLSFGPDGSIASPSYSQVGAPALIQGASAFGPWIITFLLGFFAATAAASVRARRPLLALLAVAALAGDAAYGGVRLASIAPAPVTRIGLAADDSLGAAAFRADRSTALAAAGAYGAAARALAASGARLVVFPEKLAILSPAWRAAAIAAPAAAAPASQIEIVMGFDDRTGTRRNEALVFTPDGAPPRSYLKRHFVGGLEDGFAPGRGPLALTDRTGIAICKDMDYPAMLRADARAAHMTLVAVPAWDFDRDGYAHARPAILRGVEGGFAVARAARQGLLMVTDAYGREVARARSGGSGMTLALADVARGPGDTPYLHIGDAFAWICVALSLALLALAARRRSEKS